MDHFQKQVDDLAAVKKAVSKDKVKGLFIESLANPGAVVSDIAALAEAAHAAGVQPLHPTP